MLTFLIPVRHPDTVKDWPAVTRHLAETAASIAAQSHPGWRCFVAVEEGAALPVLPAGIEVIRTAIPPAILPDPRRGMFPFWEAITRDKGARLRAAYRAAPPEGHFMVTDYDDLVSHRLAGHCADAPEAAGWYLRDGVAFAGGRLMLHVRGIFHQRCGTSHILAERILAPARGEGAAAVEHGRVFLGSHIRIRTLLDGTPAALAPLPFAGAVYRVGLGGNASGNTIRSLIRDDRRPLGMLRRAAGLRLAGAQAQAEFFGAGTRPERLAGAKAGLKAGRTAEAAAGIDPQAGVA